MKDCRQAADNNTNIPAPRQFDIRGRQLDLKRPVFVLCTPQLSIASDCFKDVAPYQYNVAAKNRRICNSCGQGRPQWHVGLLNWRGRSACALFIRELVARKLQNAGRQAIVARSLRRLKETLNCIGGEYILTSMNGGYSALACAAAWLRAVVTDRSL